ncbi:hypothetical protein EMCRGX_G021031 [Ephydatia muelleri]
MAEQSLHLVQLLRSVACRLSKHALKKHCLAWRMMLGGYRAPTPALQHSCKGEKKIPLLVSSLHQTPMIAYDTPPYPAGGVHPSHNDITAQHYPERSKMAEHMTSLHVTFP